MATFSEPGEAVADIGVIGMAVMGRNLALNMADHGYQTAIYNRTTSVTEEVLAEHPAGSFGDLGGGLVPAADLGNFVKSIKRPRRVVILVKAGRGTDAVIDSVLPLLEKGDCIIDGGNAEWNDTERREHALAEHGILFVGSGVSGGEEGARFGPSLMPGGKPEAWELIKPVWMSIAAKVDPATGKPIEGASAGKPIVDAGAEPCAAYVGPGGAGHYVKMVHNGIEYGDMQLICEAYHVLRDCLGMSPADMSKVFAEWNAGDLDSFLIEITADILQQTDPETGKPFVDVVLDTAGQKGTGKWTSISALDLGVPTPTITEAVFARLISAIKEQRQAASDILKGPGHAFSGDPQAFVGAVRDALYCSKICSYAQGFALMGSASAEKDWDLDFGSIAQIWRGGCIIRARFLQKITEAYHNNPQLANLLLDPYFRGEIERAQDNWRRVVAMGATCGVPTPAFSSALAYYDSYRTARLPANLLQAQRDYFGSHTYERVDQPRGKFFHLEWLTPGRPQSDA